MDRPCLSLIIPTYQREDSLRRTLALILGQRSLLSEVIVVDQTPAHGPETERFISEVADQIRHIRLDHPSLPAARNAGVREARGDIVLFLDDDAFPGPDLALQHLEAYADPSVGAVAGRVHVSAPSDLEGYPWPDGPDIFDRGQPGERPTVRGCNMSYRRELLLQAGLFDERYVGNAVGEEEDMAFAIRRLGYRIAFAPEGWVIHLKEAMGGCRQGERDIRESPAFYRNKAYFAFKNLDGLDFWRVLWDTYRSGACRGPNLLRRQAAFLQGLRQGHRAFTQAGWRLKRLPYRWQENR